MQRVRVITAKRESPLVAKLSIQTPTGSQVTARRLIQCGDRVLAQDIFACVILPGGGLARVAIHRRPQNEGRSTQPAAVGIMSCNSFLILTT
jgi:hypothetical protein